jgi:hypothetical protein
VGDFEEVRVLSDAHVETAVQQVVSALAPHATAILLRHPAVDIRFPNTSDLDFQVLADIAEMRSERLILPALGDADIIMADLTWLPCAWVRDAEAAATRGWVPHRLLSSNVVWDPARRVALQCEEIGRHMYRSEVQQKRTAVFLDTAFETVREIGITWDFPALGLFWLHMAHSACLAAMLDGMRRLCPNVFTRPFDYLDDVGRRTRLDLRTRWINALHLNVDVMQIVPALRRVHAIVADRFPEPEWPSRVRGGTRCEYRYWLSNEELEWRIKVALEMTQRGESAGAIFYLRFCAYATARLPMVYARAGEGRDVSFLRPEQAVMPELRRLIPEIIEDLDLLFAGTRDFDVQALKKSLAALDDFRGNTLALLRSCGAPVPNLTAWTPYQPECMAT